MKTDLLEYNTGRSKMLMPEYGRNVQKMVEYLLTIEDRAKCLKNAEAVIELMGTLNPHLKTIEDYKHKLWDHLYQMTDFSLDVDSPYPMPTRESVFQKPEPLPYPQEDIPHRHLGKNLEALLQMALKETDEEKKHGLTQAVGYYMKLAYTNWHKELVHDDMVKTELAELSKGALQYETGGYRIPFENPRSGGGSNFKQRNNRNFKGGNQRYNNQGGSGDRYGGGGSGGGNNFNKNRKYKNNKNNK